MIDPLKPDPRPYGGSATIVDPSLPHVFGRHADGQMVCCYCDQPPDNELHTRYTAMLLARAVPPDSLQTAMDVLIEHFASCQEFWEDQREKTELGLDLSLPDSHQPPGYWEVYATARTYDEIIEALRLMRDGADDA